MIRCLVNGSERQQVASSDRGLHYGDGLFESLAIINGKPRHWQLHMQRLAHGCARLKLVMPDPELLFDDVTRVALDLPRAVVKIIITRGSSGRGYRFKEADAKVSRVVISYAWPDYPQDYYSEGVRLRICETQISQQPALAGLKHLNRLENVLARNEWQDDLYAEGLMCDNQGLVIEGTMSNLFWVEKDSLFTPSLLQSGVHGIMRQRVIASALEMGIACHEQSTHVDRLQGADELFVCNSIIGIWPATLGNTPVRGQVTGRLMQQLASTDGILFI